MPVGAEVGSILFLGNPPLGAHQTARKEWFAIRNPGHCQRRHNASKRQKMIAALREEAPL